MTLNDDITFFAETTFRNLRKRFGIRTDDRRRHMYVIGKTGMGKSEMLANMIIQDIQRGNGVAVVDPHGELAEKMLDYVPAHRVNDVVYVNPADIDFPIAFNVMENVDIEHRHLVASGMMGVFKKIWPDVWSARMEYILNNAILALLEYPGSTLLGVNRMLSDKEYRGKVVDKITDPVVKAFWTTEFARYTQRLESEATASIQNKVGQFISNPLIRNIVGQVRSKINMREVIDTKKILIVNLSKGRVGEDNSRLLGAMLVTKLQLAAMSRVDIPEEEREDFYLYVDEFQNFATDSFANILSEARKYRLSLVMAHQYIAQIGVGDDTKVRDAVFGNVGTMICFRIGAEDAEFLEKEFEPDFMATDLVNLPKFQIYLKLMINGVTNRGFSAITLPPFDPPKESFREKIIKVSRERYGTPRLTIEEKVGRWWSGVMMAGAFKGAQGGMPGVLPAQEPPQLFEATCANCGKRTYVTFEPDGKRPVYCKKCLKQKQQEIAARTAQISAAPEFPREGPKQPLGNTQEVRQEQKNREPLMPPEDRSSRPVRPPTRPQFPENRFERERKLTVPSFRRVDAENRRQDGSYVAPPPVRRIPSRPTGKDDSRMSSNQSRFRAASFNMEESEESAPVPTISLAAALAAEPSNFKMVSDKKINTILQNPQKKFERRRIITRDPVALRQTLKEVLAAHKPRTKAEHGAGPVQYRNEASGTGPRTKAEHGAGPVQYRSEASGTGPGTFPFKDEPKKELEAPVAMEGELKKLELRDFLTKKENNSEPAIHPLQESAKENTANNYAGPQSSGENSLENRESTDEEEKKEGMLNPGETITF